MLAGMTRKTPSGNLASAGSLVCLRPPGPEGKTSLVVLCGRCGAGSGFSVHVACARPLCADALRHSRLRGTPLRRLGQMGSGPALLLRMHEYLALPLLLGAVAAWMLWRSFRRNRNALRPWKIFIGTAAAYILTAYAMALSFAAAVVPADHAMFSCHPAVRHWRFGSSPCVVRHSRRGAPSADDCGCFSGAVRNMRSFHPSRSPASVPAA